MELKLTSENQAVLSASDLEQLRKLGVGTTQVKVSHILVKDTAKAKSIYDTIMSSHDPVQAFADQALKESSCPSKQNGGDLGWFGAGQMVPEFEVAAFAMNVGEVKTGVVTQFGTHLLFKQDERLFLPIKAESSL